VIVAAMLAIGLFGKPPDTSLVVSAGWLAAHLHDPSVVVLQVDIRDSAYQAGHIPGARFLRYGTFVADVNGVSTELPPADSLRSLFEAAGVSTATHVVLVGAPLTVSRAFFTLDYLGLLHVSVLNGGVAGWTASGHAVERQAPQTARGQLAVTLHPEIVASARWITAHINKTGMSLIDTRRDEEYLGTAAGAKGHIEGARRLEWQEMFNDPAEFTLKPVAELQRMWSERVANGDTVVAYCRVGHRSSATYLVSRLLGYPVKLYDGSYEEWSKLNLPVSQAATPLLPVRR
jgi:thiosulfate/3-mercaptopyruvate sulfurtransferase